MKNLFKFVLAPLIFAACMVASPIERERAQNNKNFAVEYLFEHDGCRVYRFREGGNFGEFVYFTSCNGEISHRVPTDSTNTRVIKTVNQKKN